MLMPTALPLGDLENPSEFIARHIGISAADEAHMLSVIGEASRRALIDSIVPRSIARARPMELPAAVTEAAALAELKAMAQKNQVLRASSARATTARTPRASSCATSWKTPPGTPPTRRIRPRSPRAVWKRW
jgi:hypothetical protein